MYDTEEEAWIIKNADYFQNLTAFNFLLCVIKQFFYFHSVCLCVYMYVYAHIFLGIIRRTHSCLCEKWKNNKPQQTTLIRSLGAIEP